MQLFCPKLKKDQNGFTLVELLVVIVILGILATMAVQNVSERKSEAEKTKNLADASTIVSALELFYLDGNDYPESGTNLKEVLVPDYLRSVPEDHTYSKDATGVITVTVGTGKNEQTVSFTEN